MLDGLLLDGLHLYADAITSEHQARLLQHIDGWLEKGRSGQLARCSYDAPPDAWRETGQGRETILFGVHVKCNKVSTGAVEPIPPALHAILDILETLGVFTRDERPDTCCINCYEPGSWLPPHVDSEVFDRPFCTLSLLSVQAVVFGESIEGERGYWRGPHRILMPVGSVLRVSEYAAGPPCMHAIECATARRVSLTFRKLGAATRARFAAEREAAAASGNARRERRRAKKLARGWRPPPGRGGEPAAALAGGQGETL